MTRIFATKKLLSIFIIGLFITNFIYISFIQSASSLTLKPELSSPESNAIYGSNPYTGVNCTKLGEYDSNIGKSIYDFSAAEFSNKKVAYISTEDGILVYDYSDPNNPEYVTEVVFDFNFLDSSLIAFNNLLFVGSLFSGMAIIDFSNLRNPQILFNDQINNTNQIYDIIIKNDILYGREYQGFVILNISDMSSPKFLSTYEGLFGTKTNSFYIDDDHAFLIYDQYFEIVDISDSNNPVQLAIYSLPYLNGSFMDIHVLGEIVYAVTTGGQLLAIDYYCMCPPILVGYSTDSSKSFNQISICESLAYVLDQETGIHVFDIYNPTEITLISRNYDEGDYETLFLISDYLFLYDSENGIKVYSLLDHQNPDFISIYYIEGKGLDIAISGNSVLIANGHSGLEIYSINAFNKPKLRSRILSDKYCRFVQIKDKLAYVYTTSPEEGDIHIIDFSDLDTPVLLQTENVLMYTDNYLRGPSSIQVCDDFLIASYKKRHISNPEILRVYDLTTKTNFDFVDQIEPGYFRHFTYQSNYLYLVNYASLTLYSYNPQNLSLVSQITSDTYSDFLTIYVIDNYAFVSAYDDTIVFNISDSLSLFETFRFSQIPYLAGMGYSQIVVSSDIIYALTGDTFYFINFEDRNSPYLEGIFSCDEYLTSFVVSENKVYLSAVEVNLEIVQLNRFIKPRVIIIVAPIASVVVISGIAVLVLILRRRKIKKQAIQN